ncbi:polysaccharide deacetylase family protein [Micromonospora sp. 4G57]|uniref:Polysaccharide deacetylase family protein n=1 Tax=Micromonospora sicca TaxID=2202420 RepID=A0ABU5JNN8_9ACTN|nr:MULTISPECIES: polysaccharide deacetylase family protein [unclassified Micromonospora]MDZ5447098.1 polysaccharide deacetylase family protein [Micromonospora sp. 4G57]MDZ5494161.1 polysaccharide deacetylase family protein [Micromonospora sp. 4G53]
MATGSSGAAAGIVIAVVAGVLGSSYALGHAVVPDGWSREGRGSTTNTDSPQYADQPPVTTSRKPSGETNGSERSIGPDEAGQDGQSGPSREYSSGGPFGARTTTGTSRVALTFDDGPDPRYTSQVLTILREHHVTATFCVVGENAQKHPDLVQAIVADGHTLCNHSWNHDVTLGRRSPDAIRADLLRTNDAIRAAVPHATVAYYRQPGGAWTTSLVSLAQELGMIPLHWSADPSDWRAPGAERIAATVMASVQAGSILLLHDAGGDRQGTVEALDRILPALTNRFQVEALPTGTT